jgi:hypothetical protein
VKTIPENLAEEAAKAIAPLALRSPEIVRDFIFLWGPLQWRGDRIPLARFQEAWTDRVFFWEPKTDCPEAKHADGPHYFPLCGGRLGTYVISIGD